MKHEGPPHLAMQWPSLPTEIAYERRTAMKPNAASSAANAARPKPSRAGTPATLAGAAATRNAVGLPAPGCVVSSLEPVASLVPLPSASKLMVAWLLTEVPTGTLALMSAWMVIVTVPPAGIEPFHVTVFVPTFATAVPELAVAEMSVSCDGNTSVISLPGLFDCAAGPALEMTTV